MVLTIFERMLLCLVNLASAMSYHTRFVRCDIPPVRIRNNRERDRDLVNANHQII